LLPHSKNTFSIKASWLKLFMEIITVCFENHKKLKSTPCGVNAGLLILKQVVHAATTVL
jgi:hypothetical protein